MTVNEAINKVCELAEKQVGYKAGSNKSTKYTQYLDDLGDYYNFKKNGYNVDWCDIFVDYLFAVAFTPEIGRKMIYQPKKSTGAGCGFSAGFYRQNNAWSKTPQRGAQIFYGRQGSESHTGIVIKVEEKFIWTVEGNTGGGNGEVQKKKVSRSANIAGYGIPNWSLVATKKFERQWGIDISEFQGNFDFTKAKKAGVQFVIIRAGSGQLGIFKDKYFESNYKKAKAAGIPVGVYWYFNAFSTTEAKREADFLYNNCLKGKQFELPIFLDVEGDCVKQSRRQLTDNILVFYNAIRHAGNGYWVGIYSSTSIFNNEMYDDEIKNYAHWVADWRNKCYYKGTVGIWQYTDSGKVAGETVDLDYMYIDYESQIKAKGLNGWGKNPEPTPSKSFKVKVTIPDLYIRAGAGTNTAKKGFIKQGTYTITETKYNGGYEWGKLSNGQGWIALDYTTRI